MRFAYILGVAGTLIYKIWRYRLFLELTVAKIDTSSIYKVETFWLISLQELNLGANARLTFTWIINNYYEVYMELLCYEKSFVG